MSLIKKIDVPKHFAARRAMRLAAVHAMYSGGTGVLEIEGTAIEGDGAKDNSAKLIEGVSPGHSSSGVVPAKD
jgi:hypothetical protein